MSEIEKPRELIPALCWRVIAVALVAAIGGLIWGYTLAAA